MASSTATLLRRLARPPEPPPSLSPARALRLAAARAAERGAGLAVAALGVAEESGPLDDLLGRLGGGLLIRALAGGAGGLVALDAEAAAAAAEAQTLGRPLPRPVEPRAPTAADAALAEPWLDAFLRELAEGAAGAALGGWPGPAALGAPLPGAREAALALPDGRYRAVRITLDLGPGGRQGLLVLLARLPEPEEAREAPAPGLGPLVLGSATPVRAVLHRLPLPLDAVEGLAPGQVLALPGVTVASARLESAGLDLGPVRLGQVAGMRAVRLEAPLSPRLAEARLPPAP